MKKQLISFVTVLSILISLAVWGSARNSFLLSVTIPFDFNVGKTILPAGQYRVGRDAAQGTLKISGVDVSATVVSTTAPGTTSRRPMKAMLIFHRYGDKHFLAQVWDGYSIESTRLPESRAEREARDKSKYLAQNGGEPEIVKVLAQ